MTQKKTALILLTLYVNLILLSLTNCKIDVNQFPTITPTPATTLSPTNTPNFSIVTIVGKVDMFLDPKNATNGSIKIGSEITGFYKINSNPSQLDNYQPHCTTYWDAVNGGDFELNIGNYKFTSKVGERVQLSIYNYDINAYGDTDSWYLFSNFVNISGPPIDSDNIQLFLVCSNEETSTITSTAFFEKPELSDWKSNRIAVAISDKNNRNVDYINIAGAIKTLCYQ